MKGDITSRIIPWGFSAACVGSIGLSGFGYLLIGDTVQGYLAISLSVLVTLVLGPLCFKDPEFVERGAVRVFNEIRKKGLVTSLYLEPAASAWTRLRSRSPWAFPARHRSAVPRQALLRCRSAASWRITRGHRVAARRRPKGSAGKNPDPDPGHTRTRSRACMTAIFRSFVTAEVAA